MKEDKRVMDAKELRIGNFVCWKDEEEVFQLVITGIVAPEDIWVEMIMKDGSKDGTDCGIESVRGIPLDEEWLNKFGLIGNVATSKYPFGKFIHVVPFGGISISYETNGLQFFANDTPIQFVHQLQNLYYALTSEELKIK